jgi:hypothetical protein
MWVQQNINIMSYYEETRVEVDGGLTKKKHAFHSKYQNYTMAKGDDD